MATMQRGHPEGQGFFEFKDFFPTGPWSAHVSDRVASHAHSITTREVKYHAEESEIGENIFSMKLSYLGRSFLIAGHYTREHIRSFDDPDFMRTKIRFFELDKVLAYRNGRYFPEVLSKTELVRLRAEVFETLSDPFYNTTLAPLATVH